MKGISIRHLQKGDEVYAELVARKFLQQAAVSRAHLADLLSDERNIVIIAESDDSPVGFLVAHQFPALSGERLVYLYDIEVEKSHRRSGIGRDMVTHLKEICRKRNVNRIWVGSSLSNAAACALWEATGAKRVSDQYIEFNYDLATPN